MGRGRGFGGREKGRGVGERGYPGLVPRRFDRSLLVVSSTE